MMTELRTTNELQALVVGVFLGALTGADFLSVSIEYPETDEVGNYLPVFHVVGKETGTRLRVEVHVEDLLLDLIRGTGSQKAVIEAYAVAIRNWSEDQLAHGPYWKEVNEAIIERWSEPRLKYLKREAWKKVSRDA
jgi:hypothetical protein